MSCKMHKSLKNVALLRKPEQMFVWQPPWSYSLTMYYESYWIQNRIAQEQYYYNDATILHVFSKTRISVNKTKSLKSRERGELKLKRWMMIKVDWCGKLINDESWLMIKVDWW